MGSPLGPLFANFYMSNVEEKTLSDKDIAPHIYCRYVDDIFVDIRDNEHLQALIDSLQANSVLRFTYELNVQNKLPFLDVLVTAEADQFTTTVHRKTTDASRCLNAKSECPTRYKTSVIRAFIKRAIRNCSTWELLHSEFGRIKQILVNNGYSNADVDSEINQYLERMQNKTQTKSSSGSTIQLYYRNFMSTAHKVDERALHEIVSNYVTCTNPSDKLKLTIYYQNQKTSQLLIRNNPMSKDKLKRTNVVYKFSCPNEDCRLRNVNYIGVTTTSLSRRLTMHLRDGAPLEHMSHQHNTPLTRKHLVDNTDIIKTQPCKRRLFIAEALLIRDQAPSLNKQLKSCITLDLWG